MVELQSGGDLLGRAALLEQLHHLPPQAPVAGKLGGLGAQRAGAGALVRAGGPIARTAAHPAHLAADGRRCSADPPRDRVKRLAGGDPGADLLALDKRQP
jgi:hypothetical protein